MDYTGLQPHARDMLLLCRAYWAPPAVPAVRVMCLVLSLPITWRAKSLTKAEPSRDKYLRMGHSCAITYSAVSPATARASYGGYCRRTATRICPSSPAVSRSPPGHTPGGSAEFYWFLGAANPQAGKNPSQKTSGLKPAKTLTKVYVAVYSPLPRNVRI